MKIKISKAWSLNMFAIFFMLLAAIFAITLIWNFYTSTLSIAVALFIAGIILKKKNIFVIFRSYDLTNELTKNTLDLLKLSYRRENDILELDKTGTKIKIVKVGFVSVIMFYFLEKKSTKEKYISDTLVKYQQ